MKIKWEERTFVSTVRLVLHCRRVVSGWRVSISLSGFHRAKTAQSVTFLYNSYSNIGCTFCVERQTTKYPTFVLRIFRKQAFNICKLNFNSQICFRLNFYVDFYIYFYCFSIYAFNFSNNNADFWLIPIVTIFVRIQKQQVYV